MTLLSAMAVVVAGLTVGGAVPAQAATITSGPVNLLVVNNSFTITLAPADASSDLFNCANINSAGTKAWFTFAVTALQPAVDGPLKGGTWACNGAETVITISGVAGLTSTGATVAVTDAARKGGGAWDVDSVVALGQSKVSVTSTGATFNPAANRVLITLTDGTFALPVGTSLTRADSFTFAGDSAARFAASGVTFTVISSTAVAVSGLSALSGTNNTVTVLPAAMTNGAASATAAATLVDAIGSANATLTAAENQVIIRLSSGFWRGGTFSSADFTLAGDSAARFAAAGVSFNRTSATDITVSGLSGLSGTNNNITVPAAALATEGGTVSLVPSTVNVTTMPFDVLPANDIVIVTLSGGTFKTTAGGLAANQFTFGGTTVANEARFNAATTFMRISDTEIAFSDISGLVAGSNTVTVTAAAMVNGAASATAYAFPVPASAPTDVTGVAGNAQVVVSWNAPGDDGGSSITGYTVTGTPGGTCTVTGTTCTIAGLTNGTAYTFTVVAANEAGDSVASDASAAVTPVAPAPGPAPAPTPAPAPAPAPAPVTPATPVTPAPAPTAPVTPVAPVAPSPVQVVLGLNPTQVQALPASALAALPPAAFAVMSPAQVKALNPEQVSGFSAAQIQAIPAASLRAMKPRTLNAFTVDQIRSLTSAQASDLRTKQINGLGATKKQIVERKIG